MNQRKPQTPAYLINADIERLSALVKNLLIKNINFENGFYFREYPRTERFVREVLREQAEHILLRIDEIKDRVSIELQSEAEFAADSSKDQDQAAPVSSEHGGDFWAAKDRVRWCLVAHTKGTTFSFDDIQPKLTVVRKLGELLDSVAPDDPSWREVAYLKEKELRDKDAGKGFSMQYITPDATSVPTIRKGYAKGGSTDPRLRHPDNPDLSRLLTPAEHARIKGVPEQLVEGLSATMAHQELGQGVVYIPFEKVGERMGEHISRLVEEVEDKADEEQRSESRNRRSFGIG